MKMKINLDYLIYNIYSHCAVHSHIEKFGDIYNIIIYVIIDNKIWEDIQYH